MKISELFIQEYIAKNKFVDWDFFTGGPFNFKISSEEEIFLKEQFANLKKLLTSKGDFDITQLYTEKLSLNKINNVVTIHDQKHTGLGIGWGGTGILTSSTSSLGMMTISNVAPPVFYNTTEASFIKGKKCSFTYEVREKVEMSQAATHFGIGFSKKTYDIYIPELEYIE